MTTPIPEIHLKRLKQLVNDKTYLEIIESYNLKKPTTLRVNTLKSTSDKLITCFNNNQIPYKQLSRNSNVFIIPNTTVKRLTELDEHRLGHFYIQSISSMLPPIILDPHPNELVLDITAAPGSKTTQMAAMMHNQGQIIANDVSFIRNLRLKANLQMQGVINTKVTSYNAQEIWKKYPEYFDKTLVDVPCSMDGRFSLLEPKTHELWSLKKVKMMSDNQKWILRSAISATKVGGEIVYSTCTSSPEENEQVISWILEKEKGKVELISINFHENFFHPGIKQWNDKTYANNIEKTIRIYPSKFLEGFYVAKLKKVRSTIPTLLKS